MKKYIHLLVAMVFIVTTHSVFASQISGVVVDQETGDRLPGANIVINGTNRGAATDIEGEYTITGVPAGNYTLSVSYIGYTSASIQVTVKPNLTTKADFNLTAEQIQGEEVVITAQAAGQIQAINQQISSKTVKNIVSKKQIQELPEANAAEAVGRLPGVALERSGGEGSKVLIRGMAAKYSLIQVDGVNMAATGENDRSSDLSMISPYMLEGIELTKSVMANQEATATGGIVNFRIKKAPDVASFNLIAQGGYNSLRDTYDDFKISLGASNRYFSKRLGIYAQVDYEEKDNSSQQLGGVGFYQENESAPVETNSMQLMDIYRNVQRLGGALVLDYSTPSTQIKFSNFYSGITREEARYQTNYGFESQNFQLSYTDTPDRELEIITNALQIDHRWGNWEMNAAFSHAYSGNTLPRRISSTNDNSPTAPFDPNRNSSFNVNLDPETIPDLFIMDMYEAVRFMYLGGISHDDSKTKERDLSGELNFAYNFDLTQDVNVKLNFGGKYKHKKKEFNQTTYSASRDQGYLDLVFDNFKDQLSHRTIDSWISNDQFLYLEDFLDSGYDGGDFLDGRYYFGYIFNKDMFRGIDDVMMGAVDLDNQYERSVITRDFVSSVYSDYYGTEDYYAFYVMPEINIGPQIMFVPGVRFESNQTEYTGYRGNRQGILSNWRVSPVDTVTKTRNNEFVLPMIQLFVTPKSWMTIKAGYTHTLQRPDYNNIMPGWVISSQGSIGNLSNFRLKPEMAKNWDLQLSLHSNKIGLFSVGGFYKTIDDMIFWTGQKAITDTSFFELPSIMNRRVAAWATNNENTATNYGFEVEWQSNFWYLPGLMRGLVMNVNYTRNISEAEYLRTRIETIYDPITFMPTSINRDTTYKSPMIQQPDHLLNLTLGYDYKGFSIRWAMRYKSNIFTSNSWYEKLRGYSTDFYRYDMSVKQVLPVKGLELFLNVNNLTNEKEHNVINHMDFTSYLEDYGRNANMGLRYQF